MDRLPHIEQVLLRSRRVLLLAMLLALAVLATVVGGTTWQLRRSIREQIAGRDGEVLYAVALMHYAEEAAEGTAGSAPDPDPLSVALRSAQLRGVLGVRLFGADGRYLGSFPPEVTPGKLAGAQVERLRRLRPASRFHPRAAMAELFYPEEGDPGAGSIAVLEVNVPLHPAGGPLAGIAQFLVEGQSIASEYARLDRRLLGQALAATAAGGSLLCLTLGWAFRRLRRAHRLISERTENLLRANQELALAAKTSALGAVTAHLIHGLKSPLAGLQNYVAARGSDPDPNSDSDWQQALSSTRRMQALIQQVVGVLREDALGTTYEITPDELEHMVRGRLEGLAESRGVRLETAVRAQTVLPNRVANLVALILVSLGENAIQASPRGKAARLVLEERGEQLQCEVRDEGPGFPADVPLFMPCHSTKDGGTGIGLALGKQLANHLGARLDLTQNSPQGCVFTLSLPLPAEGSGELATVSGIAGVLERRGKGV